MSLSKFRVTITYLDNFWVRVDTDPYTNSFIKKHFSVFKNGAQFSQLYKDGTWDGSINFYTAGNKLPVGLLQELLNFLNINQAQVFFANSRTTLEPKLKTVTPDILPNITLRDYQVEAVNECLKQGMGIVKVATGGGKTVMICAALKAYDPILALVVANQINLVMQLKDRMISYGFDESKIGIIYGGEKDYKGKQFVFSTIQSIMNYPEVYKYAEVLIVDECKHTEASTYVELSKKTNALVKIGFDATPFTNEDQVIDWTIKKSIGDVIYEKTTRDLINMKILVRPLIGMLKVENESAKNLDYRKTYTQLIVMNDTRNNLIKKIVEKENGKILILIREIEHGRQLQKLIPDSTFLWGEIDSIERYREMQNFINSKEKYVLIGSTIFDEGIDFEKGIDAIVIASAGKGFRKVVQRLGRALRPNGKGFITVYDFYDTGNKYLKNHSESRKVIYENEGHHVSVM